MKYRKETEAKKLIKSGHMIPAIKLIREANDLGMFESKNICEAWAINAVLSDSKPKPEPVTVSDWPRWEYQTTSSYAPRSDTELNEEGAQGWELCCLVIGKHSTLHYYTFKRRLN